MRHQCADDVIERVIREWHVLGVALNEIEVPQGAVMGSFLGIVFHFGIGIETDHVRFGCSRFDELKIRSCSQEPNLSGA